MSLIIAFSKQNKPNHTHPRTYKADTPFTFRPSPSQNTTMVFSSNPLSLNVPEEAFESWLRESGYLEVLDQKTTELHRLNTSSSYTTGSATNHRPTTTTSSNSPSTTDSANSVNPTTTLTAIVYALIMSIVSSLATLLSLFTLNPISKLTADDFSGHTPSWTTGFIGSLESYSFPSSSAQAKMRVHENVKRFARNYATLSVIFFACTLYQMPLALAGLLSCLALWEFFRFCDHKWFLDRPIIQQIMIRCCQCASAVILLYCNVQAVLVYAFGVSYAVMILHASFRKLTPAKHPPPRGRTR